MTEPRYIDANALYEKFKNGISDTEQEKDFNQLGRYLVSHAPTADVVKVVHGEWLPDGDNIVCSACNKNWNIFDNDTYRFKRCPECGAKMDGRRESEGT